MLAASLDLELHTNAAFTRDVFWTDQDDLPKQLYGYTCWVTIYRGVESVVTLLNPHVYPDPNKPGLLSINAPWPVLNIPAGSYTYEVLVKDASENVSKLLHGQLKVS